MSYVKAFDDAEFERRSSAVRHRMEDAGFDLLVCQDPANMNWLTGFDGWSFYTPQAVLVHRDDAAPIWFGRAQDARSASITTHLPAASIVAFSESLVHHPTGHPFDELCELIRRRGWEHARIGVDFDSHYYTARAHRHLVTGLPGDATVLEAGMCFHFQSGMWLDDFGAAISESFVVTQSGGERLCAVDRELFVVA